MAFTTFSTALSGLGTNTQGLNVVGNNLANLNTVAFKTVNISFLDVLGESLAGGQIGLGARIDRVAAVFNQGGLETTNNPTDVAIQGPGFFVVSDGVNQLYTRAGNFHLDKDGQLVNPTGKEVQGYAKDPVTGIIDINSKLRTIKVPSTTGNLKATSEFELVFNLNGADAVGSVFSTTLQLYDSLGDAHLATVDFVKDSVTATQTDWKFDMTIAENELIGFPPTSTNRISLFTGAVATTPPAEGTLVFDNQGKLTSVYLGATPPPPLPAVANVTVPPTAVTIPAFNNSAILDPAGISWNLLDINGDLNATGLSSPSNVTFTKQAVCRRATWNPWRSYRTARSPVSSATGWPCRLRRSPWPSSTTRTV